jgi:phage replication O-like protein O
MGNVLYLEEPPAEYVGSPQVEDGHTKIANELLDAIIRFDFTKRELNIVLFVIRKTYGYNKKSDWIALSQFADGTGLDKAHVSRSVSELVEKNVLLKRQPDGVYVVGLNKHYGTWKELPKQQKGCQNSKAGVAKRATTKDKLTKDNIYSDVAKSANLPDFIPQDSWDGFVQMRKQIKKPLSGRAVTLALNKLAKFHSIGYNLTEILDKSTLNGWQDLYEPKEKPTNRPIGGNKV